MIPEHIKEKIDSMTYQQMLCKWRFASMGDPLFTGETGEYFTKVMEEKRNNPELDLVAISKKVGWEK